MYKNHKSLQWHNYDGNIVQVMHRVKHVCIAKYNQVWVPTIKSYN